MKTFRKVFLLFLILCGFPVLTQALTTEEAAEDMAEIIVDALLNNHWIVSNTPGSPEFYDIKLLVGSLDDGDFSEAYNNINGGTLLITSCSDCDQGYAVFHFAKENNDVYFSASLVSYTMYQNLKKASSLNYDLTINRKGLFKGSLEKSGTFYNINRENVDQVDMEEGRISNPKVVGLSADIVVPDKSSSFWDNAGSNKCYYFRVDYSRKSDFQSARYKVSMTSDENIQNYIFWANDPVYTLASSLVEDAQVSGVYGVSSENIYGICNGFGKQFHFQYYDSNRVVVGNHIQEEEVKNQNGDESSITYEEASNNSYFTNDDINLCEGDNCDISLSGLCNRPRVAQTLKFLGILLFIVKIFVPFLIIVLGSVDFAKAMLDGKTDEIPKKLPIVIKRLVAGIIVFLIPSIINFLFRVIDTYSETMEQYDHCRVCIFEPDDCN